MAKRLGRLGPALLLVIVACSPATVEVQESATARAPGSETERENPAGSPSDTSPANAASVDDSGCSTTEGVPFREDATVELGLIASDGGISVNAAEYPLPGPTDGLWSQWGQGVVSTNGMHYSGVGDHEGADGNSYLFEYDPDSRTLTRFMDVLSLVDHQEGAWGYGKLHSQMVTDICGSVWLFTYWGTRRDLVYGNGYEGDLLLQVDTRAGMVVNHGPVAGRRGVPSLTGTEGGRYLVGEAVDPESGDGDLVVFDTTKGEVVHRHDDPRHAGFRALAVDAGDRVLYSVGGGEVWGLDPRTGEDFDPGLDLPSEGDDFLRAATPLGASGTFYGVMREATTFFSVGPDGDVVGLAPADGYTTSIAMAPDGSAIYWLPDAHGGAWEKGAVVRAVDTATGEVEDVVGLVDPFEEHLGLLPGGTYSIVFHDGRLILGVNASPLDDDSGFGTVVLVVIEGL